MAIALSNLTFTNQADIVPASGVEEIVNTGIANTLAGNDKITGTKEITTDTPPQNIFSSIFNSGTLNTADGNDTITGTLSHIGSPPFFISHYSGIYNIGSIYTGDGNDIITGINEKAVDFGNSGIYTEGTTIDTGDGNDIITGITQYGLGIENRNSTINTGDGNDQITGSGISGLVNYSTITTGKGRDIISGTGEGGGTGIGNRGEINIGDGNDIITGTNTNGSGYGIFNGLGNQVDSSTIDTGDGNDILTGIAAFGIFNTGIINTGDGADSIICDASSNNGTGYGFYNTNIINTGDGNDLITEISGHSIHNLGIINTGNGDDFIIAEGGFYQDPFNPSSSIPGSVLLGNGKDYIKGFGRGIFNGGNGKDTLELTSGSYTVGISGTAVNFTKGSTIMETSEFEKLIAGDTTYNFSNLTNGQTIFVA